MPDGDLLPVTVAKGEGGHHQQRHRANQQPAVDPRRAEFPSDVVLRLMLLVLVHPQFLLGSLGRTVSLRLNPAAGSTSAQASKVYCKEVPKPAIRAGS